MILAHRALKRGGHVLEGTLEWAEAEEEMMGYTYHPHAFTPLSDFYIHVNRSIRGFWNQNSQADGTGVLFRGFEVILERVNKEGDVTWAASKA
jgi:hypothetical protein